MGVEPRPATPTTPTTTFNALNVQNAEGNLTTSVVDHASRPFAESTSTVERHDDVSGSNHDSHVPRHRSEKRFP